MENVHIIIPSSGLSTRFGKQNPKLFQLIGDRPVISHTIKVFEQIENVGIIVVTLPLCKELEIKIKQIIHDWKHDKVLLVNGGETRHRSVFNALNLLKSTLEKDSKLFQSTVVLVHDGARPVISHNTIKVVAKSTVQFEVVGVVRPMVSTVIELDQNDFMINSLNRQSHWASEMPQGFLFRILHEAYKQCSEQELDSTSGGCLKLVADKFNVKPKILKGDLNMFKITYKDDLALARIILLDNNN